MTKFKYQLRQQFKTLRQKIPENYRESAGLKAAEFLVQQSAFKNSEHVACYLPTKEEFNSLPIIEKIWQAKKKCYLPILSIKQEKFLHFIRYQYGDALRRNKYGILEPVETKSEILPNNLDLVITPLLAFDLEGNRLGTGGGYYDKTFAFIREEKIAKPYLIGLGYAAQQTDEIPHDLWDIQLQSIVTENGIFLTKN